MDKLKPQDLFSLEEYHKRRSDFRASVMAHKRNRQLAVGPSLSLLFEDRLTMQYQVQEMLRAERIFEPEAIAEELAAYNPLIPDGTNLKATMMLEYPDVSERRAALQRLSGVEDAVYVEIGSLGRVFAHADISPDGRRVAYGWLDDRDRGWVRFVDTVTGEATPAARAPVSAGPWASGIWHPGARGMSLLA